MELLKLVAVLGVLLTPVAVNATCNKCNDGHTCVSRTQFQFCDNRRFSDLKLLIIINNTISFFPASVDQTTVYECPEESPICVDYGAICFPESSGVSAGCGDTSNCGVCSNDETFACTSRTTFALCSGGAVTGNNINCTDDYVCSVSGASTGSPCISRCLATDGDICDVALNSNEDNSTTTTVDPTATTTSDGTTDSTTASDSNSTLTTDSTTEPGTTTTIIPPDFNEQTYCQGLSAVGRYPIPNDTVCTSYVYCVYRSESWSGIVYQCPPAKPYFNANDYNCGTVQPTSAGCLI
ncbi:hypothetical protein KR074_006487 [Drosophila pseudoananassae]|nr:hypothetical protein KR074_006487 [Drosophila pseudoananassae]